MIKLSIITINYNNAEGLRKTLASVASQTYPHLEHIIVDGGSTDESVEILEAYPQPLLEGRGEITEGNFPTQNPAHKVIWVSEKDTGIYNAMNKGIEIALGRREVREDHISAPIANSQWPKAQTDYIQILNSGDILAAPDVTERMMAALQDRIKQQHQQHNINNLSVVAQHTTMATENNTSSPHRLIASSPYQNHPAILYGNMIKEYPDGKRIVDKCLGDRNKSKLHIREIEWTMCDFIKGTINHDPAYIHRSLYEKYGLYDDKLKIVSDWKWFVSVVVFGGEKVFYTPVDVTIFDMTGISETNLIEREKERHDELEKILPWAILRDYDTLHFPISQYKRLKRYKIWSLVYFIERILFKFEKWGILNR